MNKSTNPEQEKLARLFARLDENLAALQGEWEQMSWRFVRFSSTLVLTAFRSLGTGTYAMLISPP